MNSSSKVVSMSNGKHACRHEQSLVHARNKHAQCGYYATLLGPGLSPCLCPNPNSLQSSQSSREGAVPLRPPTLTRPASLHVLTDSTSCVSWFPCFCGVLGLNRTEGTELQSYSRTAAWRPCKRRPGGPSASLLLVSWYVLADPRVQISRSSSFVPTTYGARRRRGELILGTRTQGYSQFSPTESQAPSPSLMGRALAPSREPQARRWERGAGCARREPSSRSRRCVATSQTSHTCIFGCTRRCPCPQSRVTTRG